MDWAGQLSDQGPTRRQRQGNEPTHRPVVGALVVGGVAAVLVVGLVHLPRDNAPLPAVARYAVNVALPKWHVTEPVNEIVYGTRGFDTFGETFLLLAAVVSVIVLTRQREARRGFIGEQFAGRREQAEDDPASGGDLEARDAEHREVGAPRGPLTPDRQPLGAPGPERSQGMSVVARTAARITSPLLAIAGLYLVAWGYSPGGGFPAGAVLTGVVLLAYATFGYAKIAKAVKPAILEPLELAGALLIIAVEAFGLILKGSFSANWLPLAEPQTIPSGGILQVFSGAEFVEVATGLVLVIFALLAMRHDWTQDAPAEPPSPARRRRP